MDTPLRAPRRKLKKVLKKVNKKLNSSTKVLSQKKLKAAINTSLNSTQSVRGLKSNNYNLAMSLENVKHEVKILKDEQTYLLEENYQLREKVISLQRMLGETESYINEEIERKFKVRVEQMKDVIKSLGSHMSNFFVDLEQLAQICFSRSSSLEHHHTETDRLSSALDSKRKSIAGDSGDGCFQGESCERLTSPKTRTSYAGHDISVVMEQSVNEPSCGLQYESSCLDNGNKDRRGKSLLPQRVRKSSRGSGLDVLMSSEITEPIASNSRHEDEALQDVDQPCLQSDLEEFDKSHHVLSMTDGSQKMSRNCKSSKMKKANLRKPCSVKDKDLHIANEFALNNAYKQMVERSGKDNLCLLSEPFTNEDDEKTINFMADMELTMPVDALILTTEDKDKDLEPVMDSLSSVRSRSRTRKLPEDASMVESNNDDLETFMESMNSVRSRSRTRKLPGDASMVESNNDNLETFRESLNSVQSRSRTRKLPEDASMVESNNDDLETFRESLNSVRSRRRTRKLPGDATMVESNNDDLETFRESLNSVQSRSRTRKLPEDASNSEDLETFRESLSSVRSRRRTKVLSKDASAANNNEDLEPFMERLSSVTSGEQAKLYSEDISIIPSNSVNEDLETFRESLSSVRSRRRTRVLSDNDPNDQSSSQSSEELVPDAVTMRKLKRGQFKYAVGRKDSDGCRKEIVNAPSRARSKSKKRIAELIEQLPQEKPKSIFDFHDKTPTFVTEKNNETLSVFSLADESTTSPIIPLRKGEVSNTAQQCNESTTARKQQGMDQTTCNLLGKGDTYSETLKDSPSNTHKKTTRTSRSRSCRVTKNSKQSLTFNEDNPHESNEEAASHALDTGRFTLLGEGITYSEPLKDSPVKTPKVTKRVSKSLTRLTRSASRSLECSKDDNASKTKKRSISHGRISDAESNCHTENTSKSHSKPRGRPRKKLDIENDQQLEKDIGGRGEDNLSNDALDVIPCTETSASDKVKDEKKGKTRKIQKEDLASIEKDQEQQDEGDDASSGRSECIQPTDIPVLIGDEETGLLKMIGKRQKNKSRYLKKKEMPDNLHQSFSEPHEEVTEDFIEKDQKSTETVINRLMEEGKGIECLSASNEDSENIGSELDAENVFVHVNSVSSVKTKSRGISDAEANWHTENRSKSHSKPRGRPRKKLDIENDQQLEKDIGGRGEDNLSNDALDVIPCTETTASDEKKGKTRKIQKEDQEQQDKGNDASSGRSECIQPTDIPVLIRDEGTELLKMVNKRQKNKSRDLKKKEMPDNLHQSFSEPREELTEKTQKSTETAINTNCLLDKDTERLSASNEDSENVGSKLDFENVNSISSMKTKSRKRKCQTDTASSLKKTENVTFPSEESEVSKDMTIDGYSQKRKDSKSITKNDELSSGVLMSTDETSSSDRAEVQSMQDYGITKTLKVSVERIFNQKLQAASLRDEMRKKSSSSLSLCKIKGKEKSSIPGVLEQPSSSFYGNSPTRSDRQRRTKVMTSYAEPPINKKLRRGDPFTSSVGQEVKIFKSPKLQGSKKSKSNRGILESLHNLDLSDVIME